MRCSKIIVRKTKPIGKADAVQVFCTEVSCKRFYPEMQEGTDVWPVADGYRILRCELAHHRGIVVRFIRCVITELKTGTQVQVFIK